MSPDGRDKTPLGIDAGHAPSNDLHNGLRWFLRHDVVGGYRRLCAVSEDGQQSVPLTDDPSVEFVLPSPWWGDQVVRWVPGDQAVSYVAYILEGSEIVEAGIYKQEIAYDADGNPMAKDVDPDLVVVSSIVVDGAGRTHVRAERGHAWSPDGSRIVYINWDADGFGEPYPQEVRIVDDPFGAPGGSRLLTETSLTGCPGPDWSVNDVIVYASGAHWATLELMDPDDASSRTTLIQVERRAHDFLSPSFSPDGGEIVYCDVGPSRWKTSDPQYVSTVYLVSMSNARTTKLTTGQTTYWR